MSEAVVEMPKDETGHPVIVPPPANGDQARRIVEAVAGIGHVVHPESWDCSGWHYQTSIGCVPRGVFREAQEMYPATVAESMEVVSNLLARQLVRFPDDPKVLAYVLETLATVIEKSHLAPNNKGTIIAEHMRAVFQEELFPDVQDESYKKNVRRGGDTVL